MPLLRIYMILLYPVAKPTAMFLNWWLGREGIRLLREDDLKALIKHHVAAKGEVGPLEGTGAKNFFDLDDMPVGEEGEPIDPRSIVMLDIAKDRPVLLAFSCSPDDPLLRHVNASGKKWVIIVDRAGEPAFVLDADQILRDALFDELSKEPEEYWHRPIVVRDARTPLGSVIGRFKIKCKRPVDDVIEKRSDPAVGRAEARHHRRRPARPPAARDRDGGEVGAAPLGWCCA
jgi:hypothetical protein